MSICRLALMLVTFAAVSLGADGVHAAADAKTVAKCQVALQKQGAKLVAKTVATLTKCADGVAKCLQTINDAAKREACVTKARAGCGKALAGVTAARGALAGAVAKACAALDLAQVTDAGGLGFDADDCSAVGVPLTTVGDLGACVAAQHACRAQRLVVLTVPRARELLQFTPPAAVDVSAVDLACLFDQGGSGADVDDVELGKRLGKCQKAVGKATAKLVGGRLKTFEKCVGALFTCTQTATGDALAKCRDKARTACVKAFDKQRDQAAALGSALGGACGDPAVFTALRSAPGGGFDALLLGGGGVACASLASLADLATCLASEADRLGDELVRFAVPTAATLLG